MNERIGLLLYTILSYINLVFAIWMGFGILNVLPIAFSQPAFLFQLFLFAGVVLYSFSSFRFLQKGLRKGYVFQNGFKDFIKVNSFVTLFYILEIFLIFFFINYFNDLFNNSINDNLSKNSNLLTEMDPEFQKIIGGDLASFLYNFFSVLFLNCLLLFFHILFSFRFIKKNPQLFEKKWVRLQMPLYE